MSFLKALRESETAVFNNYDVNYTLNRLNSLQESCETIDKPIPYTIDMVPVIANEDGKYMVDSELFSKCIIANNLSVKEGAEQLCKECKIDETSKLYTVVQHESVDTLYNVLTKDPSKINARCEAVEKHIQYITDLQESGVNVVMY